MPKLLSFSHFDLIDCKFFLQGVCWFATSFRPFLNTCPTMQRARLFVLSLATLLVITKGSMHINVLPSPKYVYVYLRANVFLGSQELYVPIFPQIFADTLKYQSVIGQYKKMLPEYLGILNSNMLHDLQIYVAGERMIESDTISSIFSRVHKSYYVWKVLDIQIHISDCRIRSDDFEKQQFLVDMACKELRREQEKMANLAYETSSDLVHSWWETYFDNLEEQPRPTGSEQLCLFPDKMVLRTVTSVNLSQFLKKLESLSRSEYEKFKIKESSFDFLRLVKMEMNYKSAKANLNRLTKFPSWMANWGMNKDAWESEDVTPVHLFVRLYDLGSPDTVVGFAEFLVMGTETLQELQKVLTRGWKSWARKHGYPNGDVLKFVMAGKQAAHDSAYSTTTISTLAWHERRTNFHPLEIVELDAYFRCGYY